MDQELELLQSRMTLLVAKCVDALHTRIIDLQGQMAHLQQEYEQLQQQVHRQAMDQDARPPVRDTVNEAPGKMSPEQRRQIQQGLSMLGALSGWSSSGADGTACLALPLLAAVAQEHRQDVSRA